MFIKKPPESRVKVPGFYSSSCGGIYNIYYIVVMILDSSEKCSKWVFITTISMPLLLFYYNFIILFPSHAHNILQGSSFLPERQLLLYYIFEIIRRSCYNPNGDIYDTRKRTTNLYTSFIYTFSKQHAQYSYEVLQRGYNIDLVFIIIQIVYCD